MFGWNIVDVGYHNIMSALGDPGGSIRDIDWGTIKVAHVDTGVRENIYFGRFDGATHLLLSVGQNFIDGGLPIEPPHDIHQLQADVGVRDLPNFSDWSRGIAEEVSGSIGDSAHASGEGPISRLLKRFLDGHGTSTASILCGDAKGSPFGPGEISIAPGLPTIPYRVMDVVIIATETAREKIADAIRHAIGQPGCVAINISLGFPFDPGRAMGAAIDEAYEAGVIVCAASGHPVIDRVTYPAKFERSIGVGGYKPDKKRWYEFENESRIDVWAPAVSIPFSSTDGNGFHRFYEGGKGTSFATPLVTATAALWCHKHRNRLDQKYGGQPWKRVEAFRECLKASDNILNSPNQPKNGSKRLDVFDTLVAELPDIPDSAKKVKAADESF